MKYLEELKWKKLDLPQLLDMPILLAINSLLTIVSLLLPSQTLNAYPRQRKTDPFKGFQVEPLKALMSPGGLCLDCVRMGKSSQKYDESSCRVKHI